MSLIIIGKLLVGGGSIAAVSVGSIFLHKYLNKEPISISGSYIVVEAVDGALFTSSPFTCQLAGESEKPLFPCKIETLNWDNKNHLDYSSNNAVVVDAKDILTASNSVFKITVEQEKHASIKDEGKKLEIIFTKDSQKYTDAQLLFFVDNAGKTFEGKAEYFVAKAPSPSTLASLSETETYQCSWDKDPKDFKDCEIYDFAATDPVSGSLSNSSKYESLTFQKTTTQSSSITEHKHYLIKFTEAIKTNDNNLDKTKIVFIKKNAESETITFSGIKSSFLIEDKLLILGSQPQ